MVGPEEVVISVTLHELEFMAILKAAQLTSVSREQVIRRAITDHLVQLQKDGFPLGIVFPLDQTAKPDDAKPAGAEPDGPTGPDAKPADAPPQP